MGPAYIISLARQDESDAYPLLIVARHSGLVSRSIQVISFAPSSNALGGQTPLHEAAQILFLGWQVKLCQIFSEVCSYRNDARAS